MTLALRFGAWNTTEADRHPREPFAEGYVERVLAAGSDPFDADNEANAQRLAAQMVAELFARARDKARKEKP